MTAVADVFQLFDERLEVASLLRQKLESGTNISPTDAAELIEKLTATNNQSLLKSQMDENELRAKLVDAEQELKEKTVVNQGYELEIRRKIDSYKKLHEVWQNGCDESERIATEFNNLKREISLFEKALIEKHKIVERLEKKNQKLIDELKEKNL